MAGQVTITLSGILWDRAVDSIGQEHGQRFSRRGDWTVQRVGFGSRLSITTDRPTAVRILAYMDAIGRIDGSGMDPDGAADARAEAAAAKRAAVAIRRQISAL